MSIKFGVSQTKDGNPTLFENKEDTLRNTELKGLVLDLDNHQALPYANIYVLHKDMGSITNEMGQFSIDISGLDATDTLRFQYIGYKNRNITIRELDTLATVYLKEEIINLSETIIFGTVPDVQTIVKNVLKFKDSNYKKTTSKKQTFIREREIADINNFKLDYKKSTISELDRDMIQLIEDKMPEYYTSYTDFLGYQYFNKNRDDSVTLKTESIRIVSLKEKDIAELQQLESIFENLVANTGEEEYWKVKSGIFGRKLDVEDAESEMDSIEENKHRTKHYNWKTRYSLAYSSFDDKDQWEFLHNTNKYNYTLAGGTRVNGEDAYIIDFTPKKSGHFIGRMYISINTFALIRSDYDYAPGKTGTDIQLLGVGYTEDQFSGSIYFEKKGDNYLLKYFSLKQGMKASVDRRIALLKKKERWLFDKNIDELRLRLNLAVHVEESVEYLVLNHTDISAKQFADFEQEEYMDVIYVDQFDDNLWQGYSILEPTKQMREYKKQEVNYSD